MAVNKNLFVFVSLILVFTVLFAGCSGGGSTPGSAVESSSPESVDMDRRSIPVAEVKDNRVGTVKLVSDGKEITPVGYKVFELHSGGKIDDLQAPISSELAPNLPTLTYAPDFTAKIDGKEQVENPDYFIFDENQEPIYQSKDLSTLEPGKHTVVMGVYWGNAVEYVGTWYYFNLEVK